MASRWKWALGILIAGGIVAVPIVHYRAVYNGEKRFREVEADKFYRCGQMSADGFRKKLREHKIKLVINLQDEDPDPLLAKGYPETGPATSERRGLQKKSGRPWGKGGRSGGGSRQVDRAKKQACDEIAAALRK